MSLKSLVLEAYKSRLDKASIDASKKRKLNTKFQSLFYEGNPSREELISFCIKRNITGSTTKSKAELYRLLYENVCEKIINGEDIDVDDRELWKLPLEKVKTILPIADVVMPLEESMSIIPTPLYKKGQKVMCRWKDFGLWYPAVIQSLHKNGTYTVRYEEDDSIEINVITQNLKPSPIPTNAEEKEEEKITADFKCQKNSRKENKMKKEVLATAVVVAPASTESAASFESADSTESASTCTTTSKKQRETIPKRIREEIWNRYIGEDIPKHKCLCCLANTIKITDFHVGHVVSEKEGGDLVITNLRPICASCNHSMGTQNMVEFIKKYGFYV